MNELLEKFLKKLREEEKSGRRVLRSGDPAIGLEYNGLNSAYLVSREMWKYDIARTPQVIPNLRDHTDVHGEAWVANRYNSIIQYKASKCFGRGRF